jgi:hypothetical protein
MCWLLKCWYVWVGLFLFLGLTGSAAIIYTSRNQVNQESFDRLQVGMTIDEVEAILGKASVRWPATLGREQIPVECGSWFDGPSTIHLKFNEHGKLFEKNAYLESRREHIRWHVRKAMEKIGVNWP